MNIQNRFIFSNTELKLSDLLLIYNNSNLPILSELKINNFIVESESKNMLTLDSFIDLIINCKSFFKPKQPKSKQILAENVINVNETQIFDSIMIASKELNIKRETIRYYLNESNTNKLYKKT